MGQAKNRGNLQERIKNAAARKAAKVAAAEEAERKWKQDVADAIKKHGLDLGIISNCRQRIVAVRFEELIGVLERLPPRVEMFEGGRAEVDEMENRELLTEFVDDFGPQDKQEEGK